MRSSLPTILAAAVGLFLTVSEVAHGEESPKPVVRALSLAEALAHAQTHEPALRASFARVRAAERASEIPRGQWLPTIGLTAQLFAATANNSTGTYLSAPFVDVPRIGGTASGTSSMTPYASTFVAGSLQQELFDFGRIAAQVAAADAAASVAREQARADRLDVELAVEEAYFAVYAAKSVRIAADGAEARARVDRDFAKVSVDAGLRSPIELTRAEADLARFALARDRAGAGVLIAQSNLAATIGSEEPLVDVTAEVPQLRELPKVTEALRRAREQDPLIRVAEARVRAQEQSTRAIGAENRPNLALTSTFSMRDGGAPSSSGKTAPREGWSPEVPNWDVGVVLSFPIFSGVTAARERVSRAEEVVRREELALVSYRSKVAVQQAFVAVDTAERAIDGLGRAVDAAKANYDQAEARFRSGLGSSVELSDAEALRTQAEIELAQGRFALARARITLARTIAEEP